MNQPKFQWNRILPENQVIVRFRHKLVPTPVFYLFPTDREAQRGMTTLQQDPDVLPDSILSKRVSELFPPI